LPWFAYLLQIAPAELPSDRSWTNLLAPWFWGYWMTDALGVGIHDPLLSHFGEYLASPHVDCRPTYLVGIAYGLAICIGLAIYARAAYRAVTLGWGKKNETSLAVNAALWGFGVLLTISACVIHRHYLLIAFPLGFVWLAGLALGRAEDRKTGRRLLLALCLAQIVLTAGFLGYIHVHQGAMHGYYGRAYGAQATEE
jgi:hypothetical protein